MKRIPISLLFVLILGACGTKNPEPDAYGNFEAVEYTISAEAQGKLQFFKVEEGNLLEKDAYVGLIDTVQLFLKKAQYIAQKKLSASRLANIESQISTLEEQKKNLLRDKQRAESMLKDDAVPRKQLEDIDGNLNVLESQVKSTKTQFQSVYEEIRVVDKQIEQMSDQISRCYIRNPIKGTVLEKFAETSELITSGKPLYKLADLEKLELTAYLSGKELSSAKIGDSVLVFYDAGAPKLNSQKGIISWISAKAEFTPKIIQTREERVNLVYAVKVRTRNNGEIKIGMPGEVRFLKK
jgi:HlyD family secretion protein